MNICGCGNKGADSTGRCFDCVQRDYNIIEMEQRDKRSLWKIRDIQKEKNEKARQ